MIEDEQNKNENKKINKSHLRKAKELELKKQLLLSPESFITERASDDALDKLSLKIKLIGGTEFVLSDYIADEMAKYESKFFKDWYYALADLYQVERSVMDVYVKPKFVRLFTIQFIYGRFPYLLLRTLRGRNRKNKGRGKLFQYVKKSVSHQLDIIISQVYDLMLKSESITDFKIRYSEKYNIHFQVELFS